MMNSYVIPIEIYNHDIILVTGNDTECIKYLIKHFDLDEEHLKNNINENAGGCVFNFKNGLVICWVNNPKNKLHLMHEIDHCCYSILRNIGCNLNEDSEEAYSYLKTYIQKLIESKLKVIKKKVKKL